jgi:tetratricopeptide (TPR) repeat protein
MAGPSRIDELRKKFDENPRRYFAPLANEYRKLGDFDQAIFICQEFLPQQPGHMSGHIVYGQALFEAGRHDEARTVFETALALDPENLIALRHLGDIARAHGDNETARAWYRRVLESDPRNEEIAGILTALDADEGAAPAGAKPTEAGPAEVSPEKIDIQSALTSAAPGLDTPPAADPIVEEPLTSAPAESTFDELAKLFTSAEPPTPPPAATPAEDSLGLIHEGEDVLGRAAEMHAAPQPSAIDGISAGRQEAEAAPQESATFSAPFLDALGTPEPPAPEPPATEPVTQAPGSAEPMVAASPPAPPREETAPSREAAPDPNAAFVTETMAELYLRQGHRELAADVYRKLVALHPGDTALRVRLEELERPSAPPSRAPASPEPSQAPVVDAGPTIREFLASIAEFRPRPSQNGGSAESAQQPPAGASNRSAQAHNDGATLATSLHSLFADAEAQPTRRDAPAPAAPPQPPADLPFLDATDSPAPAPLGGRPSAPAASELSLDHVFRHATPAVGSGAQPSSFSFDQFFSQQAHQDVSAAESESPIEGSGGASDDIQQFNAWLEGLKKT